MAYLDNAATCPMRPEAIQAVTAAMQQVGNPASTHAHGRRADDLVAQARQQVAALLGVQHDSCVVFTSGGTEAINHALRGAAAVKPAGRLAVSAIEHDAVLNAAQACAQAGWQQDSLAPNADGVVTPQTVQNALRPDTRLAAVMAVNNQTGAVQPVEQIAAVCRAAGCLYLADVVQAAGHIPLQLEAWGVDLAAVSAHKFGGPMGVGCLYIRQGVRLPAFMLGGGQERHRRAGTLNVPGIVGMGAAAAAAMAGLEQEAALMQTLRSQLRQGIAQALPQAIFYTDHADHAPGILSVTFPGVKAEGLVQLLDRQGISVSLGSACNAGAAAPSHVLQAMGVPAGHALNTIRISLGWANTAQDVQALLHHLPDDVHAMTGIGG